MRPVITLDPQTITSNFRALQTFAGVPVRPVIKSNGYNWGYKALIEPLDALCDAYCVADLEEALQARRFTRKPMILLGNIRPDELPRALDAGAVPTIGSLEEIRAVSAWAQTRGVRARVRVGVFSAAGWSGIDLSAVAALAEDLGASPIDLEVWTHVTDPQTAERQAERLAQAVHLVRNGGGRVTGTDLASTYPLAASGAMGSSVRVGIGLFGSTGESKVSGVRCALRIEAPVVRVEQIAAGTNVGYGAYKLEQNGYVLTARCGYADGLPKGLASTSDILSVGMQYAILRSGEPDGKTHVTLLGPHSDLDAFAAAARAGAHEIVTALGNAAAGKLGSN